MFRLEKTRHCEGVLATLNSRMGWKLLAALISIGYFINRLLKCQNRVGALSLNFLSHHKRFDYRDGRPFSALFS
jgi:hypothetical protein